MLVFRGVGNHPPLPSRGIFVRVLLKTSFSVFSFVAGIFGGLWLDGSTYLADDYGCHVMGGKRPFGVVSCAKGNPPKMTQHFRKMGRMRYDMIVYMYT